MTSQSEKLHDTGDGIFQQGYLIEENVFSLFYAQADALSDSVAVVDGETSVTYGELARRADRIAAYLSPRIEAEQPIGVNTRRSADMIAVMLGILKAGGAYVPLDPDDPPERNRRILDISGCKLVLGHAEVFDAHPSLLVRPASDQETTRLVDVGEIPAVDTSQSPSATAPGGSRLAYVLFTSGSGGDPKGVEVQHQSIVNLLNSVRDLIGFTGADRFLAASSIGFDISVAEIFLPLITGGSLLLRDRKILLNPKQLAEDIARFDISVFQSGPSVWSLIATDCPNFPTVRVAISTGEAISRELAAKLIPYGEQVWNLYGPTEATVWATAEQLTEESVLSADESSNSAPIGRPLANTQVFVADQDGKTVAYGTRGELCIGGLGLARGYRDDTRLTEEKFIYSGPKSERLYRTGDLATQTRDGQLLYFGRIDDQLSIRGVRVEPGEIQSALLKHPDVRAAAVTWYSTPNGTQSIAAAIVPTREKSLAPQDLNQWLAAHIPPQMIPSRFLFRKALPLTPSGKIDHKRIRNEAQKIISSEPQAEAGRRVSNVEYALMRIWQRLLKLDAIAVTDHFFSIGGDSLAAVSMMTEVERVFQISLPVQIAFENPTLEKLAARIRRALANPREKTGSPFIFPLKEMVGRRPLFFNGVDMRLATEGRWTLPCPLYSISHWAHGSGFVKANSLEDLARLHVAGIRSVQSKGPYRLAGYSFGGLLALESAQQLRRLGQEVEILFLLDPMQPARTAINHQIPLAGAELRGLTQSIGQHSNRTLPSVIGQALKSMRHGSLSAWINYHIVHLHGRKPNPISQLLLPKKRWPAFWHVAKRLAKEYVAEPYDGPSAAFFSDRLTRYQVWADVLGSDRNFRVFEAGHMDLFVAPILERWTSMLAPYVDDEMARPAAA